MSISRGEANRRFDEFRKQFDLQTAEALAQSGMNPFEGRGRRLMIRAEAQNRITKQSDGRFRRARGFTDAMKRRTAGVLKAQAEANQLKQARDKRRGRKPSRQLEQFWVDNWRLYDIIAA